MPAQIEKNTTAFDALIGWGELKFREMSLGRDAEEREWQEEGLFYQRRQWLDYQEGERRYVQLKPDKNKPRPMPVSNYFARTVNANANQLSKVRVIATPRTDDASTRRSADYAEMAKDAIDEESGLNHLLPLLAKHTALWGMGVTKDTVDTTEEQEPIEEQELESTNVMGCLNCGSMYELGAGNPQQPQIGQQQMACPDCGSQQTLQWTRNQAVGVSEYVSGKGKIKTEVRPIFEIYLPRDVQNPNLSPLTIHHYHIPLSRARRIYGEAAEDLKADDAVTTPSEQRMDVLKTLTSYTFAEKASQELCWITEVWCKWDELPKELQKVLEDQLDNEDPETDDEDNESVLHEDDGPDVQMMKKFGLFFCFSQGVMLDFGENDFVDPDTGEVHTCFTFFPWDLDPANVYPKGIGADLVPLQKRLNRLDSLIELSMMSNAAGKWLWPSTQNNKKPPTGDPTDVAEYDPIGDGKIAPEFVQPSPFHGSVWNYRAAILQDFQQLGLTLGVQTGGGDQNAAFRTVAYLGAKASEQLNTQRYLWEQAHCLRYKKTLCMAKKYWDEERSVKVAGPNGKFLFESFSGEALRGLYELSFVPNSSTPKTLDEKMQMLQTLIAAQLVDVTDPSVRQYIYDLCNLEVVNLTGEVQFRKAERDLEMIKRGEMPTESPYQDWNIELKIVSTFTLTEEFEALDPTLQSYVLAFAEYCNQRVTAINAQAQQQNMMQQMQLAAVKNSGKPQPGGGASNNKTLDKIPGQNTGAGDAENAASSQGADFAHSMGA